MLFFFSTDLPTCTCVNDEVEIEDSVLTITHSSGQTTLVAVAEVKLELLKIISGYTN